MFLRDQILRLLRGNMPLTDEEIAEKLGVNPSSARTRRNELEKEGLVIPIGFAKTHSGRRTYLWTLADESATMKALMDVFWKGQGKRRKRDRKQVSRKG